MDCDLSAPALSANLRKTSPAYAFAGGGSEGRDEKKKKKEGQRQQRPRGRRRRWTCPLQRKAAHRRRLVNKNVVNGAVLAALLHHLVAEVDVPVGLGLPGGAKKKKKSGGWPVPASVPAAVPPTQRAQRTWRGQTCFAATGRARRRPSAPPPPSRVLAQRLARWRGRPSRAQSHCGLACGGGREGERGPRIKKCEENYRETQTTGGATGL